MMVAFVSFRRSGKDFQLARSKIQILFFKLEALVPGEFTVNFGLFILRLMRASVFQPLFRLDLESSITRHTRQIAAEIVETIRLTINQG